MQELLFKIQKDKNEKLQGKDVEVLIENKLKGQTSFFGRTKNMTPVIVKSDLCNPGDLIKVKIYSSNSYNLFGKYVKKAIKAA